MKAFADKSFSKNSLTLSPGWMKPPPLMKKKNLTSFPGGNSFIQPKLKINQPNDKYEQEADRVADRVMRMPEPKQSSVNGHWSLGKGGNESPLVQRQSDECPECNEKEEDEEVQTKPIAEQITPLVQRQVESEEEEPEKEEEEEPAQAKHVSNKSPPMTLGLQDRIQSMRGGGRPLPRSARSFFEPRFGRGFGNVRVHTGSKAAEAAKAANAKAFTIGRDMVFGAGQYSTNTIHGKRLLAHELTHVVHQSAVKCGSSSRLQRTVNTANFDCPANTSKSPTDPLAALTVIDDRAQLMTLGCSYTLCLHSMLFKDSSKSKTDFSAYGNRFGWPQATKRGFRNRFTRAVRTSERQVAGEEMVTLSKRFKRLHNFLKRLLRYRCRPVGRWLAIGGCRDRCVANDFAWTCIPNDRRDIAICPDFWEKGPDQKAGVLIHEAVHMLYNFRRHPSTTLTQRQRNPECYTSYAADLYNFTPIDPKCPVI